MTRQLSVRSPGFLYRRAKGGSRLHSEQVPLTRLAERFGTPLYVYSTSAVRDRVQAFNHAFTAFPHTLCYSVKANSNLSILRLLSDLECGFDVVSGGELERVRRTNSAALRKTVFSGVGKAEHEIEAALRANILLFNVESESELVALARCAGRLKKHAPIALRVNPDVSARTHPYISTGLRQHKFGIAISDAAHLYSKAARDPRLKVIGVSVHIGSQILDARPFTEAMRRVADLVRELRAQGHAIQYVDAGGGLGIDYGPGVTDFPRRLRAYSQSVTRPLAGLHVHLLLEPGRSIIASAGVLLTRALYKKTNQRKKFVITDAAMNDLVRPALYGAYHEIVPVRPLAGSRRETVDVVGPICETGDFLARDRKLPVVEEGDLLAVLDAGAYGMALASNYNSRPRAAEVLVEGRSARLIRRRETASELFRLELSR